MGGQALAAGIFGAAVGAAACRLIIRRDWLTASGAVAIGIAVLLGTVTEGNRSHAEHTAVFAITMCLLVYFAVAVAAGQRARQKRQNSAE
jgi:hypothetical protein